MLDDLGEWKHLIYVIIGGFIARLIYDRYNERRQTQAVPAFDRLRYGDPAEEWTEQRAIPDGKEGTIATLKIMRQIVNRDSADPFVRKTAESIVKGCRGHDFLCEVNALFHFVRDRITYRRDPLTSEYIQDSRRTLESGVGDCDCKVVLLCSLLQALGHRTRFVVIGHRADEFSHVYCAVYTKQGWLPLDPTNERAPVGWEAQALVRASMPVWVN